MDVTTSIPRAKPAPRMLMHPSASACSLTSFSGSFCGPPSLMSRQRTRNDEGDDVVDFYTGSTPLRRSGSTRSLIPNSSSSSSLVPGRAQRTMNGQQQQQQHASSGRSSRPGYLMETFSSLRRSRDRADRGASPSRSISRTASLRRQASSSGSTPKTTYLRYENELKPSTLSKSNPSSYYTLGTSQHQPPLAAKPTYNSDQLRSLIVNNQNNNHSNYNSHHNQQQQQQQQQQKRRPTPGSTHNGASFLRTFSLRHKPSSEELFSSLPCLNASSSSASSASSGSSSSASSTSSRMMTFSSGHSSGGSHTSLDHNHNQAVSSHHAGPAVPSHPLQQAPSQRLRHPAETPTTSSSSRSSNNNNNGPLSVTPNSSSLVLNSLAYQALPPGANKKNSTSASINTNSSVASSPGIIRKRPVADDADGHLAYLPGDVLCERYEILSNLGEGTFGKVAKVRDLHHQPHANGQQQQQQPALVALKIIKNIHKYREAAKLEINVLRKLNAKDPDGRHLIVRMYDSFNYYGHMCLSFEVLGESVFDFLKSNAYVPYLPAQVRHISYQLCHAVAFMHDNKVTHTDLKPENVLFVTTDWYVEQVSHPVNGKRLTVRRMRDTRVKLIDFGSATFEWEHHSSVVSTRHYRAPEVILELGWGHPCDVWSIGCIIFELFQGHTLFQTHDNREHLAMMEKILSRPCPQHMARRSKTKFFCQQNYKLLWDSRAPEARYTNQHCKSLHKWQKSDPGTPSGQDEMAMLDLVARMLDYDPNFRISLKEALRHHYFDRLDYNHRLAEVNRHILRLQI